MSRACGLLALSPWHLKQISYWFAACGRKEFTDDWPFTPASAPLTEGGSAVAVVAWCGLWQSAHSAWRAWPMLVSGSGFSAELGFSAASCTEGVVSTGCV